MNDATIKMLTQGMVIDTKDLPTLRDIIDSLIKMGDSTTTWELRHDDEWVHAVGVFPEPTCAEEIAAISRRKQASAR